MTAKIEMPWRRAVIGVMALVAAVTWWLTRGTGAGEFASSGVATAAGAGRLALMSAALFVAYPTFRRPMRLVPPAALAGAMIAVGVACFRPRLLLPLLPVLVALAIWTWLTRKVRGPTGRGRRR